MIAGFLNHQQYHPLVPLPPSNSTGENEKISPPNLEDPSQDNPDQWGPGITPNLYSHNKKAMGPPQPQGLIFSTTMQRTDSNRQAAAVRFTGEGCPTDVQSSVRLLEDLAALGCLLEGMNQAMVWLEFSCSLRCHAFSPHTTCRRACDRRRSLDLGSTNCCQQIHQKERARSARSNDHHAN